MHFRAHWSAKHPHLPCMGHQTPTKKAYVYYIINKTSTLACDITKVHTFGLQIFSPYVLTKMSFTHMHTTKLIWLFLKLENCAQYRSQCTSHSRNGKCLVRRMLMWINVRQNLISAPPLQTSSGDQNNSALHNQIWVCQLNHWAHGKTTFATLIGSFFWKFRYYAFLLNDAIGGRGG